MNEINDLLKKHQKLIQKSLKYLSKEDFEMSKKYIDISIGLLHELNIIIDKQKEIKEQKEEGKK